MMSDTANTMITKRLMNKHLPLLAVALLLFHAPAWSDETAAHAGHDMTSMPAADIKEEPMSTMKDMPQGMQRTQHDMSHDQHAEPAADTQQINMASPHQHASDEHSAHAMPEMQRQSSTAMPETPSADGDMKMTPMQGGSAPADARDPNAYSDGYDADPVAAHHMGDQHNFGALLVDKLEALHTNDNTSGAYDLKAWFGRDYDRVVFKAEGDVDQGRLQDARTEILWGHAIASYWDTQLGLRHDSGVGPSRNWLAFGVEGLAPYWFDVEATAYVGDAGRTALRLAASHDILFTQKLILKPQIEVSFYGKNDAERNIGSGLSEITSGLRLRYEIRRQLAPYIGLEWNNKFGNTADYVRLAGEKSNETRLVAGVQFWF